MTSNECLASDHHNQDLGRKGENAAAYFLERNGFEILERNWKCLAGEADIIAQRDTNGWREIHFIEVKTRTSTCMGFPEEHVDKEKRQRYERISEIYLREHDTGEVNVTFDIISLLVTGKNSAFMRMHFNVLAVDCG